MATSAQLPIAWHDDHGVSRSAMPLATWIEYMVDDSGVDSDPAHYAVVRRDDGFLSVLRIEPTEIMDGHLHGDLVKRVV